MTDPWDVAGRSQAGFVVTAAGLRVPVAAPTPSSSWPAAAAAGAGAVSRATATSAPFRGVGPKDYHRSDAHVREQVCERLLLDPYLDASNIVVTVLKGKVALTGTVPSERMKDAALAAAATPAAGTVDSQLQVTAVAGARASRVRPARAGTRARARGKGGRRPGGQR